MRLLYLVHNLNDPAVARRLLMLKTAGVEAIVAGFWRTSEPSREIHGARTIPLGRSYDAKLLHRALLSVKNSIFVKHLAKELGTVDLVMARNLEMLSIAISAARRMQCRAIVYEVLDIHRLLLGGSAVARSLRTIERTLMRNVSLVLVSSPAFLREYFQPVQFAKHKPETVLIENKVLKSGVDGEDTECAVLSVGPPWRIGWLGMIRCRRSLRILGDLARRRPDLLEVRIFGRPTNEATRDLSQIAPSTPGLTFGGSYAPADMSLLYRQMHFNWAIDYYEEDANSLWLLPNRIYEGGRYNVIPLALKGTETARWLVDLELGYLFADPGRELEFFLEGLTVEAYRKMKQACFRVPRIRFVADQTDCDRLARVLARVADVPLPHSIGHVEYGLR